MNKWKISFLVTFMLLAFSNLFWLFTVTDSGITVSYQQTSLKNPGDAHSYLEELVVKGGQDNSQKVVLHLVRHSYPDAFFDEQGNEIMVNGITFSFESGKLSQVY